VLVKFWAVTVPQNAWKLRADAVQARSVKIAVIGTVESGKTRLVDQFLTLPARNVRRRASSNLFRSSSLKKGKRSLSHSQRTWSFASNGSAAAASFERRWVTDRVAFHCQVNDMSGQEEFAGMAEAVLEPSHVCLLVFSLHDRASFDFVLRFHRLYHERYFADDVDADSRKHVVLVATGAGV